MENPEEILHSLEEFSKLKPKDIPRELEEYLCFVAKTGDPVYQWAIVKSLFKEKLVSVITEFYESCPSIEVPPCPNVEVFNYETMKSFILEKLDTFVAAPFTVQRICELLTTPRKEYNRIDKYMRALEKNILVVSTTEPLNRRTAGNGEGIVNGLEPEHIVETNSTNDINVEEMDDTPVWSRITNDSGAYRPPSAEVEVDVTNQSEFISESGAEPTSTDSVITCRTSDNQPFVSIEPIVADNCIKESASEADITVTITAIPAAVQKRRDSIEPIVSSVEEGKLTLSHAIEVEIPEAKDFEMTVSATHTEHIMPGRAKIEIIGVSDIARRDSMPCEAEPSIVEICNIPVVITPQVTKSVVKIASTETIDRDRESSSLIQIPIISGVTSGVNTNLDTEASIQSQILSLQEDSNSGDSSILNEPSEVLDEVSTSTPEPETNIDSTTFESVSEVTKETTVSSTDDLNSDVDLKNDAILEETEENFSQEESSTESIDNSSEAEEKQTEEVPLCDIQEFASSSTVCESMDVSIEEETCQEAPTLNR